MSVYFGKIKQQKKESEKKVCHLLLLQFKQQ